MLLNNKLYKVDGSNTRYVPKENYLYNMFTIYWDIVELNVRLKL